MARVLALIPDLLFGSRVQSMLVSAGHDVKLLADGHRLGEGSLEGTVLILDLTADLDGPGLLRELSEDGSLAGAKTLGFYAHVDVEVRERAEKAGFDLVIPRSRMAREGAKLVETLAGGFD